MKPHVNAAVTLLITFKLASFFVLSNLFVLARPAAAESLEVGVLACLSGGCAEWGEATRDGLLIAQEKINTSGGVLGKKIELRFEDTNEATAGMNAVTAFRKLHSAGNIKFFIGPNWTPAALAIAPIAGRMTDILMISPSVGVAEFNEAAPNLFNTMMHSEAATRSLAKLARDKNWKRAAVFSSAQPWESLQGKTFREEFLKLGGEVVAFVEPNPDLKDLRAEALKVASSKPDGVFLANLNQEAIAARQLKTLGYTGPFYAALLDQTRIDEATGALEGAISAQSPEAQPQFVARYLEKFKRKPSGSADTAHDALMVLSKAIVLANSVEADLVSKALVKVQFDGASGMIRFDELGGVVKDPQLVWVSKNSIVAFEGGAR